MSQSELESPPEEDRKSKFEDEDGYPDVQEDEDY